MVMPASGRFAYVAIVPERLGTGDFECRAELREPIVRTGDDLRDSRLVGMTPLLRVLDAGLTPDPGPQRPWVVRSRITLAAAARPLATVAEVSFHVDRALTSSMRQGDEVHLARTGCGGLGLSVIRGGELVVAVGAVTAVPLGRGVQARTPMDLVARAEAVFRDLDPEFAFEERPIELSVRGACSILYRGRRTVEDYLFFVVHGFLDGIPGTNECAAISHEGRCPNVAAQASAMLMDDPDVLSISRWRQ
jgi:hypothetical protein